MALETKERILATALQEFAAYGFAGARINRIALKSRTNKQLIYYYFKSKRRLFRRVLDVAYAEVAEAERTVPAGLENDLLYWMDFHLSHPYFLRLLEWEGLEYEKSHASYADDSGYWRPSIGRVRKNQEKALGSEVLRSDQLLITSLALTTWPLVFPQVCRQITGMHPDDLRFIYQRKQFIRSFAHALKMG
jgi:AcrR family transcriptional regulator